MNDRPQLLNETLRQFDNFLLPQHLEEVRRSALDGGFNVVSPGFEMTLSRKSFKGCGIFGRHDLVLKALAGRTQRQVFPRHMQFRMTGTKDSDPSHVHSDNGMGDWTAIVYLTPDIDERSGTAFYRYRGNADFDELKDGLDFMPAPEEMKGKKWGDQLNRDMEKENAETSALWQRTGWVHGRYNRCIVFPSSEFHCRLPLEGVGEDNETGRLIWVSHFYL